VQLVKRCVLSFLHEEMRTKDVERKKKKDGNDISEEVKISQSFP